MDSYGTLWQFAWQETSSRAETSFKSLQFSRTSICGSKPSKMACCAIRRMPCPKSLISTPSYPVPSVFSHSHSRSATEIRCQGLFANKGPPCQESLNFWWKNTKHRLETLRIHRLSRLKIRKRMKLVRMNMKLQPLQPMTLSRPQTWRGLQVGQEPGYRKSQDFECCFQLQTLSALQVTLNLWLWHMMTQYPFAHCNNNKTFIPMPGCVTNVTWSVTPACSSGCPSSSTSS